MSLLSNNISKAFDSNYLGSGELKLEPVDELVYDDGLAGLFEPDLKVQFSIFYFCG